MRVWSLIEFGDACVYRVTRRAGRLGAVKGGGRRSLRFRADSVDEWLQAGERFDVRGEPGHRPDDEARRSAIK